MGADALVDGVDESDEDALTESETVADGVGEPVVEMVGVGDEQTATPRLPNNEFVVLVEGDRVGDAVAVPHADGVCVAIDVVVFEKVPVEQTDGDVVVEPERDDGAKNDESGRPKLKSAIMDPASS